MIPSLKLELAVSSEDRARGYMYREKAEKNTGILFVNEYPSRLGLWMAHTILPLSSAFLDREGKILKIHKFMEPMTHKVYSSDVPAHYMLEIPMVKTAQENNYYIVIGPPASGKGTQAALISDSFGIPHIDTGSLLREGRYPEKYEEQVQKSLTEGVLLSDEIVSEILLSRLEEPDCDNGFILDGFPRSVGQAEVLDKFMEDRGREIKRVFNLKVSEEEILKRILGRGRADDTEEILQTRLEEYYKKTKPLENYYQDKITDIEAGVSPENTFEQIKTFATYQTFQHAGKEYVSWFDLHGIEEGDYISLNGHERKGSIEKRIIYSQKENSWAFINGKVEFADWESHANWMRDRFNISADDFDKILRGRVFIHQHSSEYPDLILDEGIEISALLWSNEVAKIWERNKTQIENDIRKFLGLDDSVKINWKVRWVDNFQNKLWWNSEYVKESRIIYSQTFDDMADILSDYLQYQIEHLKSPDGWNWRNYCMRNGYGKRVYRQGIDMLNEAGYDIEAVPPWHGIVAKTSGKKVEVYHGTSKENLQRIREEGFKTDTTRSHGGKEKGIYVSLYNNVGTYSGSGGVVKCLVDEDFLIPDPDDKFEGQYLVRDPGRLEIIDFGEYKGGNLFLTWDSESKKESRIIYSQTQKYYHATFNQLFNQVMQEGLKDIAGDGGVFVADTPQKAIDHFWAKYKWVLNPRKYHGKAEVRQKRMMGIDPTKPMTIALLEVDLDPSTLERRGQYKMYPGMIPPENITFVTNFGQTVAKEEKRVIYSAGPRPVNNEEVQCPKLKKQLPLIQCEQCLYHQGYDESGNVMCMFDTDLEKENPLFRFKKAQKVFDRADIDFFRGWNVDEMNARAEQMKNTPLKVFHFTSRKWAVKFAQDGVDTSSAPPDTNLGRGNYVSGFGRIETPGLFVSPDPHPSGTIVAIKILPTDLGISEEMMPDKEYLDENEGEISDLAMALRGLAHNDGLVVGSVPANNILYILDYNDGVTFEDKDYESGWYKIDPKTYAEVVGRELDIYSQAEKMRRRNKAPEGYKDVGSWFDEVMDQLRGQYGPVWAYGEKVSLSATARIIYADKSDQIFDAFNGAGWNIIQQDSNWIRVQPPAEGEKEKPFEDYIDQALQMAKEIFPDAEYQGTFGDDDMLIEYNLQKEATLIYSSVLDLPHDTLDPSLWDFNGQPTLDPEVKDTIVYSLYDWLEQNGFSSGWVNDMFFIGSAAGYQYRDISDLDITIVPDLDLLREEVGDEGDNLKIKELVKQMIKELNGYLIVKHPVNYYIRLTADVPVGEAIYNIFSDTWIKTAPPIKDDYVPEERFKTQWLMAEARAGVIDEVVGKLKRRIDDYDILSEYADDPKWGPRIQERLENKKNSINQWVEWLSHEYVEIWKARQKAYKVEESQESMGNLIYKFLERYDYIDFLHALREIRDSYTIEELKELYDNFTSFE